MSKNLLSGNEWYCQQAFRALNQAAGRCIRHKFDYGAILLLDERFQEKRNRTYISKWLRKSIKQFDNFEQSMKELKSFFSHIKVWNILCLLLLCYFLPLHTYGKAINLGTLLLGFILGAH
ncbi:hypothetical protein IC582_015226 [Cucumis melo]